MNIGITDYIPPPFDIEQDVFGSEAQLIGLDAYPAFQTDPAVLRSLDALLVWHAPITADVVRHLDHCRVVVRYGVGVDNVDIAALEARDIPFCNTPDYGTEEVADTAAALVLGLHRKIYHYDVANRRVQTGWQENTLSPLKRARDTVVGIIGVGRIGTSLALRLRAFGYQVIGYDPYQVSGHEKAIGYGRRHRLDALLKEADIVCLHCPLSDETRGLVDEAFIQAMKPGSILVNTSRGELLASLDVLEEALRSGHLYAAGLDVLPQEPPSHEPLIRAWRAQEDWLQGRLLINPHTAYFSDAAWPEMRFKTAETALMVLQGLPPRNRVHFQR